MTTILCPNCKQPSSLQNNAARPFCSERCRMIDLGAWANENYKITQSPSVGTENLEENPDHDCKL